MCKSKNLVMSMMQMLLPPFWIVLWQHSDYRRFSSRVSRVYILSEDWSFGAPMCILIVNIANIRIDGVLQLS